MRTFISVLPLLAIVLDVATGPGTVSSQSATSPIALHPDNPHYFLWRDEPTILITSAEHYGAVLNLDFDFKAYLKTLQHSGMNHTRTWVGTYREVPGSFGITENTLAPLPGKFISPWARSTVPGESDGGMKFDLTKWDEAYFARLKDFMQTAQQSGVVVELNFFCPNYKEELWQVSPMNAANNINGVGNCGKDEPYTLKQPDLLKVQQELVRKVVSELKDFDNLYYEVCNEPYFGGVTMDWQKAIVNTIVATEESFPHQHLISLNIANGRQRIEDPHPHVSIFNFHYCYPPDTVKMNYRLNKVIGENETGFRGKDDRYYRTEGWDFIIAGGALYNNLDYSFTRTNATGTFLDYTSPGGGNPTLRKQLKILSDFMDRFEFMRMHPDDELVKNVSTKGLTTRCLAEAGRQYAIYVYALPQKGSPLPENLSTSLSIELPHGMYVSEWIDTKTGNNLGPEEFEHDGGPRDFRSPKFETDVALRIIAKR